MAKVLFYLERKLGAWLLLLLRKTLKFKVINQESSDNIRCIYMFWHRNLLMMTLQRVYHGAAVMVSSSKDGELIAGPLWELGYIPVRGSSSFKGSSAMREMIKISQKISLAITPDGPKGPCYTCHPGIFQIAYLAKIPIVAVAVNADKEWQFNSWDRFRFPKPFAKLTMIYSDPIWVKSKEDFATAEREIRDFLAKNEKDTFFHKEKKRIIKNEE
ncbi:MAG TPA: lysophospholipid acyltransferase family protein [Candidatus Cloacimonas acidaminovorans]|nr:lysophospholipid acyltransferase family protein [Candidatus Cloacimonas acidaminovorans]